MMTTTTSNNIYSFNQEMHTTVIRFTIIIIFLKTLHCLLL